ncbi:MAG: hypothetical protein P8X79_14000 [Reinekea sp.]
MACALRRYGVTDSGNIPPTMRRFCHTPHAPWTRFPARSRGHTALSGCRGGRFRYRVCQGPGR